MHRLARFGIVTFLSMVVSACVTSRRPTPSPVRWEVRLAQLQHADTWRLDGRAAVAVGTQGWQASLNWRERGVTAEVRLAGPLGVGALRIDRTPEGLALNGGAPSDTVLAQLQERLGFELPLESLRYWLLGIPDPSAPSDIVLNDQDRARQLEQSGWTVTYDRYMPVDEDWLPARLVLTREAVRVRIAVDRWDAPR